MCLESAFHTFCTLDFLLEDHADLMHLITIVQKCHFINKIYFYILPIFQGKACLFSANFNVGFFSSKYVSILQFK